MLDAWAWWEVLHETPLGRRFSERYVHAAGVRIVTVDVTLAEIAAKVARTGHESLVLPMLRSIEAAGAVVPITAEVAAGAGSLLVVLRRTDRHASLADAVVLAEARALGVPLISGDPCYAGLPDVRAS